MNDKTLIREKLLVLFEEEIVRYLDMGYVLTFNCQKLKVNKKSKKNIVIIEIFPNKLSRSQAIQKHMMTFYIVNTNKCTDINNTDNDVCLKSIVKHIRYVEKRIKNLHKNDGLGYSMFDVIKRIMLYGKYKTVYKQYKVENYYSFIITIICFILGLIFAILEWKSTLDLYHTLGWY